MSKKKSVIMGNVSELLLENEDSRFKCLELFIGNLFLKEFDLTKKSMNNILSKFKTDRRSFRINDKNAKINSATRYNFLTFLLDNFIQIYILPKNKVNFLIHCDVCTEENIDHHDKYENINPAKKYQNLKWRCMLHSYDKKQKFVCNKCNLKYYDKNCCPMCSVYCDWYDILSKNQWF